MTTYYNLQFITFANVRHFRLSWKICKNFANRNRTSFRQLKKDQVEKKSSFCSFWILRTCGGSWGVSNFNKLYKKVWVVMLRIALLKKAYFFFPLSSTVLRICTMHSNKLLFELYRTGIYLRVSHFRRSEVFTNIFQRRRRHLYVSSVCEDKFAQV